MEIRKNESDYNMIDWWKKVVFENYANFEGRARRSEFWYFVLVNLLVYMAFGLIGGVVVGGLELESLSFIFGGLLGLFALVIIVPSVAVAVRRLHDTGKSGWFYLLNFIPFGGIVLLVFYVQDSELGENKWGPNPKESPEDGSTLEEF